MKYRHFFATLVLVFMITSPMLTRAGVALTENGVRTIHLDEYNDYFAARETPVDL